MSDVSWYPIRRMAILSPNTPFDLVHVGKCGGGSISSELRAGNYDFEHYHMRRPAARPDRRYVILVRDPVARFVSAFNWRTHLYRTGGLPRANATDRISQLRHRAEEEFLLSFDNANALAEQLVPVGQYEVSPISVLLGLIGHVPHGFQWYLGRLLDQIEPRQIAGVVCTERLADDFVHLFGFQPAMEIHRSAGSYSTHFSEKARANLVREFHDEYATLKKLASIADEAGTTMSMRYDPKEGAIPNQSKSAGIPRL
jgi:hypothetical protein